jgi:streptomycin 6-kinase
MRPAQLPARLASAVGDDPVRRAWADRLPAVVSGLAERWALELGPVFEPGGVASWVAPARATDGRPVVLKVAWRHYEAEHEADGLRAWHGAGAVRLVEHVRLDRHTDALLLEACEPGTPATELPEPDQDVVVAGVLRRLWITPRDGAPFRPLSSMCTAWVEGLDRAAAAQSLGDPGIVRAGVELFCELAAERSAPPVLLATDLHAENVLAAQREPWLAIDPKPYVGDATYDPLQHLLNCPARLVADPRGLVDRMAGLLDLDPTRLARWLFARCVIESVGQPHLGSVVRQLAPA